MFIEVRVTVHQQGGEKPNYDLVHSTMQAIGFYRQFYVGASNVPELNGMYRRLSLTGTIDEASQAVENALAELGFRCSFEIFEVRGFRKVEVEPQFGFASLLGYVGNEQPCSSGMLTAFLPSPKR